MAPQQRFYPTSWGFHPLEGFTAQLFNRGMRPGVRRTPTSRRTSARRGDVCAYVVPAGAPPVFRTRFPLAGGPELSCPVSAASAASAASPAGGPSAARRAASAGGGTRTARRAAPGVDAAGARRSPGPPAVASPAAPLPPVVPRPDPPRAPPCGPDHRGHHDEQACQDDYGDDACAHDVTLLSFPEAAPRGRLAVLRDGGIPAPVSRQSRVEEVQSFGAGWRP